jgi:Fe-Mn family superoxide dismutase
MFKLPALPYAEDGLEPYISEKTLSYHYGKHHKAYVDNLNTLLADEANVKFRELAIEEIIARSEGKLFNNAAQAYNHTFYWLCMRPNLERKENLPSGKLLEVLEKEFGSFAKFKAEFTELAKTLFGSGWAWLLKTKDGEIKLSGMHDADTPIMNGEVPLLALDIWEHAYYLDYQNSRPDYIEAFWQVVNWDFVAEQLERNEQPKGLMLAN